MKKTKEQLEKEYIDSYDIDEKKLFSLRVCAFCVAGIIVILVVVGLWTLSCNV
jgi:type IV secretory pathway component VirB8